jgi:hypothetical protein
MAVKNLLADFRCPEKARLLAVYRACELGAFERPDYFQAKLEVERAWNALEQHILLRCADCERRWQLRQWSG